MDLRLDSTQRIRMSNPAKLTLVLLLTLVLSTGCSAVGPDYQRPDMDMPVNWHTGDDPALLPQEDLVQ